MRIYISGAISNIDRDSAILTFLSAFTKLKEEGHEPINPFDIDKKVSNPTWEKCLIEDIKELVDCEAIYMLKGWHRSKGANLEYYIARQLNLKIIFEE